MAGAMLSKSLTQFSIDGWGCVPSLLFDLRSNYGGGNEDNGSHLQKICCIQNPCPCGSPLLTFTLAGNRHTQFCGSTGAAVRRYPMSKGREAPASWFSSVQFSCLVVSDCLRPHESQHARPPCPSPTTRLHSDSCPSSW